jgi:hypothetical protein
MRALCRILRLASVRGGSLLDENNAWNIQTPRGYLEDRGFAVGAALDGAEAVERWFFSPPDPVSWPSVIAI